ncbi:MAG: hypothetical protein OEV59_01765 [Deltaproteobacteria bacterium]|nr:hypothetical protein [Deltaproteobacteria bacterium]
MALTAAIAPVIIMVTAAASFAANGTDTPIEQRIIKIEGSIDKPRVIFIVPRARLVRQEPGKSGFSRELSVPAHPGIGGKQTPGSGTGKVNN